MAAHTNVCVIGLGSMGMGAARACLQAGLKALLQIVGGDKLIIPFC